jgi:hypothetical protein
MGDEDCGAFLSNMNERNTASERAQQARQGT